MTRRRQRARHAAQVRRVLTDGIQEAKAARAAGVGPQSRVDAAVDRALEERAWRAVWSTP